MASQAEPSIARKSYTSDLSDAQWELIASMLVLPEGGRLRTTDMREVFNGFYYTGSGTKRIFLICSNPGLIRDDPRLKNMLKGTSKNPLTNRNL